MISQFSFPTKIIFGEGALSKLPDVCSKMGKALIVTDLGFSKTEAYQKVISELNKNHIAFYVFGDVQGNPTEQDVDTGVNAFKNNKCEFILGVGGGSPLDVAKAIRLMATHPGSVFDYDDAIGGYEKITANLPPFVAIPTTAGTGSEVGRSSVITQTKTKTKKIIFSPYLLANAVIADPILTIDLPAKITAATGMDALTHNVESYLAKGFHPLADGIALEGIRLIARSLKTACEHPKNIQARSDMLMASMMGAIAFQKGLGVTHSLAHPLSTLAGLHHGLANAIMIVPAMKFNQDVASDRLKEICRIIYASLGNDERPSADGTIEYLRQLCLQVGIPKKLTEVGVSREILNPLVEQAVHDGCYASNPKQVTRADFEKLYLAAM